MGVVIRFEVFFFFLIYAVQTGLIYALTDLSGCT